MEHIHEGSTFVDAFCGGCNILSEMPCGNKFGLDINKYVVSFWNEAIREYIEGVPFTCMVDDYDEDTYRDIRSSYRSRGGKYKDSLIGFIGSAGSWGGGWFKGYPRYNPNKGENHIKEAYNGVVKQLSSWKMLSSTRILNVSYDAFEYPENSVIYCDPPYFGTEGYERGNCFDHEKFWSWVRKMTMCGHHVYVSEYNAPEDFDVIWCAEKKDGLSDSTGRKQNVKIEKLFTYSRFNKI